MLRLLYSSQPVVWGIVPLTSALLLALGGWSAHQGNPEIVAPWSSWGAVLLSAYGIHRMHVSSGMRTRFSMLPSWAWVLASTPFLWFTPPSWWWGMCLIWVSVGLGLRLKMGEPRPDLNYGLGLAVGVVPMVAPELALWIVVTGAVLWLWRAPKPGEAFMWVLGLATPWWIRGGVAWWTRGSLELAAWPWSEGPDSLSTGLWALLPMMAIGWMLRQQSLIRATARQRVVRKWTQWPGVVAAGLGLLLMFGLAANSSGMAMLVTGFACGVTWSLGWCFPPRWKGTKWMPWLAMMLSASATLAPAFSSL